MLTRNNIFSSKYLLSFFLKILFFLLSACSLDIRIESEEFKSSLAPVSYSLSIGPGYHMCMIDSKNALWCVGENSQFELGLGESLTTPGQPTIDRSIVPVRVDVNEEYKSISVAESGTCGITMSNLLKCWGGNNGGRFGLGSDGSNNPVPYVVMTPTVIDAGETYKMVSLGNVHTCAITSQDQLKCWGQNYGGQLGLGGDDVNGPTVAAVFLPTAVDGLEKYSTVSVGSEHTCGITVSGVLKCWGVNSSGELGLGGDSSNGPSQVVAYVPTVVDSVKKYSTVKVGVGSMRSTCAIQEDGTLECFGDNFGGKLGVGHDQAVYVPTAVSSSNKYKEVSVGQFSSCALTTLNKAQCWGYSYNGNIGVSLIQDDSVGTQYTSPVDVFGGESYSSISVGTYSSWGITESGELKFWGIHNITMDNNSVYVPTLFHAF